MDRKPRVLMCPPDHYGIEYEINPWMRREQAADRKRAETQWQDLRRILVDVGAEVLCLTPAPGLPDLVFTANAALIHRDTAVLARFRHPERQGEEPVNAEWLAGHGFQVARLPDDYFFEGAGDALFCGDTLFAGYRMRSNARALQHVGSMIGRQIIPLELVDAHYYHLDTCFCPLRPGWAIYYPAAFDEYGLRVLQSAVPHLIAAETEEARSFACNAVVVGETVVTNSGCPRLHAELRNAGFRAVATPLDEFVKAGGSAKCLTLRLDGEEAAGWALPSPTP